MAAQNKTGSLLIIAALFTLLISCIFWWAGLNFLRSWLVGINLVTLLFYGFDKWKAMRNDSRIPELVLHILVLGGGTPGAFAGQIVFRHKTGKKEFRRLFILIAFFQAAILTCFWLWIKK